MSQIGFVYLLGNYYMPDVYKVGCTERSPKARAEELSNHTSVPYPFDVICYIEVRDFQRLEKQFHEWLKKYRISESREFFKYEYLQWLAGFFYFYEFQLSGSFCGLDRYGVTVLDLIDPWREPESKQEQEQEQTEQEALRIIAGTDIDEAKSA